MTTKDRDIFDVRVRQQPTTLLDGGELYWGSFRERIDLKKRPSLDRPIRLLGWIVGKRSLVQTIHLVQDYAHTPVEEYEHGHYLDSFIDPIDVSVYGSASAIPAENWPTEEQVSSEKVLEGVALLRNLRKKQNEAMGL